MTRQLGPWKTAWITGASSGIGRELALLLAKRGVRVAVSARSQDKLAELQEVDSNITAYALDVTDERATIAVFEQITLDLGQIDLAVLNAGFWQPMDASEFQTAVVRQSFEVNFLGVSNALSVLIPKMIEHQSGQLGLVASLAGYRGLPRSAAYGASKAATIHLAEALAPDLRRHNVLVTLVNPGFVKTPMTDRNNFPMPFILEPRDAAERMIFGLEKGRNEIAFPWRLVAPFKIIRLLPYRIFYALVRRFVLR